MSPKPDLSRRTFLQAATLTSAGLMLAFCTPARIAAAGRRKEEDDAVFEPNAWIEIANNGDVTITVSKSEMGQGVRTTLAMIVAEELGADWSKVKVRQAVANSAVYGSHGTGGSTSVRSMWSNLRTAGATGRSMLLAAAAKQWSVPQAELKAEGGFVTGPGGKKAAFGELLADAATMSSPGRGQVKFKDPSEFKILGQRIRRVDNPDVVTGKAVFGLDAHVDGMLYAVTARTPAFGATPKKWNESAAMAVKGVKHVIRMESGIAVVAENTWAAMKGRDALAVEWDLGQFAELDSNAIREGLVKVVQPAGDTPATVAKKLEVHYDLPYLAHATMEPMNFLADVKADGAELWGPTQAPDNAQRSVAQMLGVSPDKVKVNTTLLGGGFGRRFGAEIAMEAAFLSKQFGKPVQSIWTRADDMQHDTYRPMSHHAVRGGIDASGNPVLWEHQMIQAGGGSSRAGRQSGPGIPYDIANAWMASGGGPSPVPTGAWRSVAHSQTGFVNESFIDELAHLAGKDPYEYRKGLIKSPRLKKVLDNVAQRSKWGQPLPKGEGRGIACFDAYGSPMALVVHVAVSPKGIVKVKHVYAAVDPGIALNPWGIEQQITGAIVDAMSTALRAEITIEKGGAKQRNYDDYGWFWMEDTPPIEVEVLPSGDSPTGMGEVGYPVSTAAVANAIFAATGKRMRRLPIRAEDLV